MFRPNDKVSWIRERRGGYGYTEAVAAIVIRPRGQRTTIRVYGLRTQAAKDVTVKTENLRPNRLSMVAGLDE